MSPIEIIRSIASGASLVVAAIPGVPDEVKDILAVLASVPDLVEDMIEAKGFRQRSRLVRDWLDTAMDQIPGVDEMPEDVQDGLLLFLDWTARRIYRATRPKRERKRPVRRDVADDAATVAPLLARLPESVRAVLSQGKDVTPAGGEG